MIGCESESGVFMGSSIDMNGGPGGCLELLQQLAQ
jgi:hypothetical protein